jgi:hypothetical protein
VHGDAGVGEVAGAGGGLGAPRQDLPALVVALAPLPEHHGGAVVHAAVVLVAVEGVEAEAGVVHHAHAAEALAHVHSTEASSSSGLNGASFTCTYYYLSQVHDAYSTYCINMVYIITAGSQIN